MVDLRRGWRREMARYCNDRVYDGMRPRVPRPGGDDDVRVRHFLTTARAAGRRHGTAGEEGCGARRPVVRSTSSCRSLGREVCRDSGRGPAHPVLMLSGVFTVADRSRRGGRPRYLISRSSRECGHARALLRTRGPAARASTARGRELRRRVAQSKAMVDVAARSPPRWTTACRSHVDEPACCRRPARGIAALEGEPDRHRSARTGAVTGLRSTAAVSWRDGTTPIATRAARRRESSPIPHRADAPDARDHRGGGYARLSSAAGGRPRARRSSSIAISCVLEDDIDVTQSRASGVALGMPTSTSPPSAREAHELSALTRLITARSATVSARWRRRRAAARRARSQVWVDDPATRCWHRGTGRSSRRWPRARQVQDHAPRRR